MAMTKLKDNNIKQILKVNDESKLLSSFDKFGITLKQVPMEDHAEYELDI